MSNDTLTRLAATIAARRAATTASSYTKSLLDKGPAACAKKLGEEAVEMVIAGVSESELDRRTSKSGHAEKASRGQSGSAQ